MLAFPVGLCVDYAMMDPQLIRKIAKRHFFQDIQNSFQWATGIGLEPNQNFFQKKNSNKYGC